MIVSIRNTELGFCEPVVTTFASWSIYNLVLCVCLLKGTLLNIYHWFMSFAQTPTALQLMLKQSLNNTSIFSVLRGITASSLLGTWDSASALHFWGHFKEWNGQQKGKKMWKHGTKWTLKGHLFAVGVGAKNEESKVLPCSTSAVNVQIKWLKIFTALCMSITDWESSVSMDLGVTNTV